MEVTAVIAETVVVLIVEMIGDSGENSDGEEWRIDTTEKEDIELNCS
ncbi:MAG: hypothetical protein ACLVIY_00275 [Anaerobutyricum soehngenii]